VKILTANTDMSVVKKTLVLKMAIKSVNLADKKPTVNPNSKNTPLPNLSLLRLSRTGRLKKQVFKNKI
jgi:hypothetical protein